MYVNDFDYQLAKEYAEQIRKDLQVDEEPQIVAAGVIWNPGKSAASKAYVGKPDRFVQRLNSDRYRAQERITFGRLGFLAEDGSGCGATGFMLSLSDYLEEKKLSQRATTLQVVRGKSIRGS